MSFRVVGRFFVDIAAKLARRSVSLQGASLTHRRNLCAKDGAIPSSFGRVTSIPIKIAASTPPALLKSKSVRRPLSYQKVDRYCLQRLPEILQAIWSIPEGHGRRRAEGEMRPSRHLCRDNGSGPALRCTTMSDRFKPQRFSVPNSRGH
jgi:hypothetical protein